MENKGLNIYSTTISGTFESATNFFNFFFAFLDDLGNFKHFQPYLFFCKKIVALSKVPLLVALLNVRLLVVHSKVQLIVVLLKVRLFFLKKINMAQNA